MLARLCHSWSQGHWEEQTAGTCAVKSQTEATRKVRKLERERDDGKTRKPGQTWTVEQWLTCWLETIIAPPVITENAYIAYEVAAGVNLIPGIGAHKLDKLEPST